MEPRNETQNIKIHVVHLSDAARCVILTRYCVNSRWKQSLDLLVSKGRLALINCALSVGRLGLGLGGASTIVFRLALSLFFLPFLSNLFVLYREAKLVSD